MAAPPRLPGPDRCWADRPSPEDSGRGRTGSGSRPGGTPCSPGQPRTGTARPRRKPAPSARSGGTGAALGAAGRFFKGDLAVRRYETCQTYNKKCRGEGIRKYENMMGENKDLVGSWSFS